VGEEYCPGRIALIAAWTPRIRKIRRMGKTTVSVGRDPVGAVLPRSNS
jgi:hypothetical protein